jgi:hypothetical protein
MAMKSIIYWMTFQILVGIWLFISPFVLEYKAETAVAFNSMLFGAIVVILGLGVSLYEYYWREAPGSLDRTLHMGSYFRKP